MRQILNTYLWPSARHRCISWLALHTAVVPYICVQPCLSGQEHGSTETLLSMGYPQICRCFPRTSAAACWFCFYRWPTPFQAVGFLRGILYVQCHSVFTVLALYGRSRLREMTRNQNLLSFAIPRVLFDWALCFCSSGSSQPTEPPGHRARLSPAREINTRSGTATRATTPVSYCDRLYLLKCLVCRKNKDKFSLDFSFFPCTKFIFTLLVTSLPACWISAFQTSPPQWALPLVQEHDTMLKTTNFKARVTPLNTLCFLFCFLLSN